MRGKRAIKPFFYVLAMANDGLQQQIEFERQKSIDDIDQVIVLVTFERGGRVQARFTFGLISEGEGAIQKRFRPYVLNLLNK